MGKKDDSVRGQAYTLEGVIGAIVIASALILGLQAVNIEPWTDDGVEQGTDIRVQVEDVLDAAEDRDALTEVVTCLGGSNPETPHPGVISPDPNITTFGTLLNRSLEGSIGYNVYVEYPDEGGKITETVLGSAETPAGASVTVTRDVMLFDVDQVYQLDTNPDPPECVPDGTLGTYDQDDIYLSDQSPDALYAVVQVRVVAW